MPVERYEKSEPTHVQAQQIWGILVAVVMTKVDLSGKGPGKITYSDLAERMGRDRGHGRFMYRQLEMIGRLCRSADLPALNSIIVNQGTGQPGRDVALAQTSDVDDEQSAVLAFDWFALHPPTAEMFLRTFDGHLAAP